MRNRTWRMDEPVGDPFGGPANGKREDPTSVVGGIGMSLLGSVLGGGKSSPAPPPITQPTVMPTPDDEATRSAKRKSLAGQIQRRGRQSTILSDPVSSDLLGG